MPSVDRATAWARAVVNGEVATGELVRLACERHLRDLENADARGLYWDVDASERVINFFSLLSHSKGEFAGRPFDLSGWQHFSIGAVFGWKRRTDGLRRFRTSYKEVPRKNGKSTEAAGVGCYLLVADGEPGAEVYAAATKRDQAKIVWGEARNMVRASAALKRHVTPLATNLHVPSTASKFEPLGADEDSLDGLNVHGVIVDELHAHKTRKVFDVLDTATGARRQPLMYIITTAGFDRQSVCYQQREHAERVLRGLVEDDTYFAFIATIDKGDDWKNPAVWYKANPNLGVSCKLDDLQRKCVRAREMPAAQNAFLRLHLNVWTEQNERALDIEKWDACAGNVGWRLLAEAMRGRECYGGLDLADTQDIAAAVYLFPLSGGKYAIVPRFWVPESAVLASIKRGSVPYDVWERDGALIQTDGNVIDYDFIRAKLNEDADAYTFKEFGFDPWNATQLATQLQGDGFAMVKTRMGHATLGEPTKKLLDLVAEGKIEHGGHPVLRWMMANLVVRYDANKNMAPDKGKATQKIDGAVATIIALSRAIVQPEGGKSFWEADAVA